MPFLLLLFDNVMLVASKQNTLSPFFCPTKTTLYLSVSLNRCSGLVQADSCGLALRVSEATRHFSVVFAPGWYLIAPPDDDR